MVQKIVALFFLGYFLLLLVQKYRVSLIIVSLIVGAFLLLIFLSKPKTNCVLTQQSQLRIYPDQVRIKDDYLTGVGNFAQGKILISGKVTDAQKELLKHGNPVLVDRKSTRLNSSHVSISYAVFCLKKKNNRS